MRFASWPATGPARGAILLAQGRTEYIEKAYEWIELFRARGLHVGTFDFRGQGLSQRLLFHRRRGFVENFDCYQDDYDAAVEALRLEIGDARMLVCGHSMGGLATLRFLSRRQTEVCGAILSAPMLGLALSPPLNWAALAAAKIASRIGLGQRYMQGCDDRSGPERGFEGNVLTHDRARFDRHEALLDAFPDLALGGTTYRWLSAAYDAMAEFAALPPNWLEVPVLIVSAEDDVVVSNNAIARFISRNPMAKRVHLANSHHEPLMETDEVQAALWPTIDAYLSRVLPPPSGVG